MYVYTCIFAVWGCAIVIYLFLRKPFGCYLVSFIGCDYNAQGTSYLSSCLPVLAISQYAVGNQSQGREHCLQMLMSVQGAACLIDNVQHLSFPSKITFFMLQRMSPPEKYLITVERFCKMCFCWQHALP